MQARPAFNILFMEHGSTISVLTDLNEEVVVQIEGACVFLCSLPYAQTLDLSKFNAFPDHKSMVECNTILSAHTIHRHLE